MVIQENQTHDPEVLEQVVEVIGPKPVLSSQQEAIKTNYLATQAQYGQEEAENTFRQIYADEAEGILQLIKDSLEWERRYNGMVIGGGVIG